MSINTNKVNQIINDYRAKQLREEQWWEELNGCWDRYMEVTGEENDDIGGETFDLSSCYGEAAYEMTGSNYVEMHCDVWMWDKEQRLEKLSELYKKVKRLLVPDIDDYRAKSVSKLAKTVYNTCRGLAEEMSKYKDESEDEAPMREPNKWDRSRMFLEFIEDKIGNMSAKEALKYSTLANGRNKLDYKNDYHLVFPAYVAASVLLQTKLLEEGWGKVQKNAEKRLEWLLPMYEKWNVEQQLEAPASWEFKEEVDSNEDIEEGVCFSPFLSTNRWEDMIDFKRDAERVAARHNISVEEAMESFFKEMDI